MLTLARTPLAPLVTNTHYAMSASDDRARRTTRRTSARLSEKENENVNGVVATTEETNGDGGEKSTRGKSKGKDKATAKRKQDYDEEDDGFMFTRTKAKKPKTSALAKVPEAVVEEREEDNADAVVAVPPPQPAKKIRTKRIEEVEVLQDRELNQDAAPRKRNARADPAEKDEGEPAPIEVKRKRKSKAKTPDLESAEEAQDRGRPRQKVPIASTTPVGTQAMTTTVALPFADTPIIRRNQEMRRQTQGGRRSSLGNRGRRASSLIDSGRSSALPHEHVESAEFFKHIEAGLPEPRRMRQLLTWCATRVLSDKSKKAAESNSRDAPVRLAAREIQQQILKDFSVRSNMSDWYGREETVVEKDQGPLVKKPNPRNVANEAKIKELEQQLQRLQSERATWENLLRPSTKSPLLLAPPSKLPDLTTLEPSLLTASNASILDKLQTLQIPAAPQLQAETRTKLDTATKDIEFQTDVLADNVHIIGQYRQAAEKVATKVLDDAAAALEVRSRKERDRSGTEEVGVRDVLRGLSRVEPRE